MAGLSADKKRNKGGTRHVESGRSMPVNCDLKKTLAKSSLVEKKKKKWAELVCPNGKE